MNSQSLSAGTTFDFFIISGKFLPAFLSKPSLQLALIQARAFSYSSLSYISSVMRRSTSVRSTHSALRPRYFCMKEASQYDPAIPMETPPMFTYAFPLICPTARAHLAKRSIFSATSSGIVVSEASCTS